MTEEDAKRVAVAGGKELYHLAVKGMKFGGKLTGKALAVAVGAAYRKFDSRTRVYQGEHALKKFIKYDKNNKGPIGKIDVNETDFKDFAKTCKKNGVDFAIVKDKVDPGTVHFFFAGKNAETMSYLFEDYARNKFQQDLKKDLIPEEREKEAEMDKVLDEEKEKVIGIADVKEKTGKKQALKEMQSEEKIPAAKEHVEAAKEAKAAKESLKIDLEESLEELELPERSR